MDPVVPAATGLRPGLTMTLLRNLNHIEPFIGTLVMTARMYVVAAMMQYEYGFFNFGAHVSLTSSFASDRA